MFTWDDPYPTNVYAINGNKHLFICDTFLGIEPMEEALTYLRSEGIEKQVIVFISHMDYDHYWGNGAFKESLIIAHEYGWARIYDEHEDTYTRHTHHKRGTVKMVPPNMIFKDKIIFPEDGVEFFYSPGHSLDSSSCMDVKDNVLFVGDNVESPIPFCYSKDLKSYLDTMRNYLERKPDIVVSGHDPVQKDRILIKENIRYIEQFIQGKVDTTGFNERALSNHKQNLKEMDV
jgi:glyoxylase-like metal-dependent hydrolase (beta-lactamase superfamily II)